MNVTVITGTTQGIGKELVNELAPQSDRLITINRRSTNRGEDEILCDLSSADDVQRAAGDLTLKLAREDEVLFVMNAGYMGQDKTLSDIKPDELGQLMYTNVFSQLTIAERLLEEGGHKVRLVGMTSAMGSIARPNTAEHYAYTASKASLNLSVRLLHKQYPEQLDYALVHPGWVQTQIGGPEAHLTPQQSARSVVEALGDPANWNRTDGMLKPATGEIVPW